MGVAGRLVIGASSIALLLAACSGPSSDAPAAGAAPHAVARTAAAYHRHPLPKPCITVSVNSRGRGACRRRAA